MAEGEAQRPAARSRGLAAAVAGLAVAGLIGVALATGGGGDDEAGGLRVERSPDGAEVIVYVEDPGANVADTAGGERSVTVECLDDTGEVLISAPQAWPFADTDQGTLDPHAHLPLDPGSLARVSRCRLKGTEPALEGRVGAAAG